MKTEVVKIDPELLVKVKSLVKEKSKRIRYSSFKQFINIAVQDLLEKEENRD